jgi:hypothetical protein
MQRRGLKNGGVCGYVKLKLKAARFALAHRDVNGMDVILPRFALEELIAYVTARYYALFLTVLQLAAPLLAFFLESV